MAMQLLMESLMNYNNDSVRDNDSEVTLLSDMEEMELYAECMVCTNNMDNMLITAASEYYTLYSEADKPKGGLSNGIKNFIKKVMKSLKAMISKLSSFATNFIMKITNRYSKQKKKVDDAINNTNTPKEEKKEDAPKEEKKEDAPKEEKKEDVKEIAKNTKVTWFKGPWSTAVVDVYLDTVMVSSGSKIEDFNTYKTFSDFIKTLRTVGSSGKITSETWLVLKDVVDKNNLKNDTSKRRFDVAYRKAIVKDIQDVVFNPSNISDISIYDLSKSISVSIQQQEKRIENINGSIGSFATDVGRLYDLFDKAIDATLVSKEEEDKFVNGIRGADDRDGINIDNLLGEMFKSMGMLSSYVTTSINHFLSVTFNMSNLLGGGRECCLDALNIYEGDDASKIPDKDYYVEKMKRYLI